MKLIFTTIAAAYAGLVCNQDGSAVYTFPKDSGHLNSYDANSLCQKDAGLTHSDDGTDISMNLDASCFKTNGLTRYADVKTWYSLNPASTMIFRSKENTVRCGIDSHYTATYVFSGVGIDNEDDKTNEVTDIGFSFGIVRYTDDSFNDEETSNFVQTGSTVYFAVEATKQTAGYSYEVPKCTVHAGSETYDLWRLDDKDYCVEEFAATTLNANNQASFTTFTFDIEDATDYSIVCDVKVCAGNSGCGNIAAECAL